MYLLYFVLFLLHIPLTVSTRYGRVRYMKAQAVATIGLELDLSGIGPYVDQVRLLLFLHACRRPAVLTCTAVCTSQVEENDYAMAKTNAEYHSNINMRLHYIASQLQLVSSQLAPLLPPKVFCTLLPWPTVGLMDLVSGIRDGNRDTRRKSTTTFPFHRQ
jgi:hypothetical protein